MKLSLFEDQGNYQELPPDVESLCSNHLQYLRDHKVKHLIWRGIDGALNGVEWEIRKGWSRGGRRPLDSKKQIQRIFDDVCEELTGIRLRESSTYTTTSRRQAGAYGDPVVILLPNKYRLFTMRDYDFTFSPFYNEIARGFFNPDNSSWSDTHQDEEKAKETIKNYLLGEGNLRELKTFDEIHNGKITGELLLVCDQYASVDYGAFTNWLEN